MSKNFDFRNNNLKDDNFLCKKTSILTYKSLKCTYQFVMLTDTIISLDIKQNLRKFSSSYLQKHRHRGNLSKCGRCSIVDGAQLWTE
jgi:hypothetical protein